MSILIICGPPAVGHNRIADEIAKIAPDFAIIDVDIVRAMNCSIAGEKFDSDEWQEAYLNSIRQSCILANDFENMGKNVLIVDVAPPQTLDFYRKHLKSAPKFILLLTDSATLIKRDILRNFGKEFDYLAQDHWHKRIEALYAELSEAREKYDLTVENPDGAIAKTIAQILPLI